MPMQRYKPEQIVTVLRQIEVALAKANGKSTPQACKGHCQVNRLPRIQATPSSIQTWFY